MCITDVAADAFADVLQTPLAHFGRQERIGDRRAGGADQVDDTALELAEHGVRRGEPADAHDGLTRELAHVGNPILEGTFAHETRRAHLLVIISDYDVPQIWQVAKRRHYIARLLLAPGV